MCYIVAHDKKQPDYEDDESSIGDRIIPKHITTEAYITDMKEMFKQIPTVIHKPLSPRKKFQKLMTEIGG